jgi:peptidoglycan/LPS O-acetylase OafA/YrhL
VDSILTTGKRSPEIDLLRFLAALTVLLYHYTYSFRQSDPGFPYIYRFSSLTKYGYLAVDLFFIISGYVLAISVRGKTLPQFVQSRVFRLYPAYWIACILSFVLIRLSAGYISDAPHVSFAQLGYNLTMFQEFFGKAPVNPVFWSLTYELSFYLLIAAIIVTRAWDRLLTILALWLMYTFAVGPLATGNYLAFVLIPKYSTHFIAGILFYILRYKMAPTWKIYGLLAVCYALTLRSVAETGHVMEALYKDGFSVWVIRGVITLFYLLFFWIALVKPDFSRFRFFTFLGSLTYPLYLVHVLGGALFYAAGGRVNKYVMLVGVTLVMLVMAWGIERVEKGVLRKRARLI